MTDAEYNKRKYEMRKREHVCVACGTKDEMTMRGRIYCAKCADANKEKNKRWAQNNPEKNKCSRKKRTEYRIENRLCVRCGKPVSGNVVHKYCRSCLDKEKWRQRRSYADGYRRPSTRPNGPKPYDGIPRNEWPDYGFCYRCGMQLDQNKKLCKRCYDVTCSNLAKIRANEKEIGLSHNSWVQNNRAYWRYCHKVHNMEDRENEQA